VSTFCNLAIVIFIGHMSRLATKLAAILFVKPKKTDTLANRGYNRQRNIVTTLAGESPWAKH
jgi:hypothetical protein